uniref:Uncharacterized protein n=1 Tax=Oryza nivara TaxID=4536 RepID=A0A0E0HUD6_ORYNI
MPRIGRSGREKYRELSPPTRCLITKPRLVRYLPPFGLLLFDPTIFNMTTIFNLLKIITCPYQSKSKC